MGEKKLSEAASSLLGTGISEKESLSQMFAREILKNPEKNQPQINDNKLTPMKEENPSYIPKQKITYRSWDENVETVKLLEAKVNCCDAKIKSLDFSIVYLEKRESANFEMFESINEKLRRIEEEKWQGKLIRYIYSNKVMTFCYLAMTLGIVIGVLLILKSI